MQRKHLLFSITVAFVLSLVLSLNANAQETVTYPVRPGDGLWMVARRYCNSGIDELKRKNPGKTNPDDTIKSGVQTLTVVNQCRIAITSVEPPVKSQATYSVIVHGTAQLYSVLRAPALVPQSEIEVFVLNASDKPMVSTKAIVQPAQGDTLTWRAELNVQPAGANAGTIIAKGSNDSMMIWSIRWPITFDQSSPSFWVIQPEDGDEVQGHFKVTGAIAPGAAPYEIYVYAEDLSGTRLGDGQVRIDASSFDNPISWSVDMDVSVRDRTEGKIRVVVPGLSIERSLNVFFVAARESGPSWPAINRFTVNAQQINPNACVILTWDTSNARSVALYRGNKSLQDSSASYGQYRNCPDRSSTYSLVVTGYDGRSEVRTYNVWVGEQQPVGSAPIINRFDAYPATDALKNACMIMILEWNAQATQGSRLTLFRNGIVIAWPENTSRVVDCVPVAETGRDIEYRLRLDTQYSGWTHKILKVHPGGR